MLSVYVCYLKQISGFGIDILLFKSVLYMFDLRIS